MALPVLSKTWQFNVNQAIAANAALLTQCQDLMYAIKNSMVSIGTLPWTVWGSSDGAGNFGNNDGVDRWAAAANCVWDIAGNNHSWIVLKQSGLSSGFSICIDLSEAAATCTECTVTMSPSVGYSSNGTATACPTATDEVVLLSSDAWGATSTANRAQKLHYLQSTDGQCSRIFACNNSTIHSGIWMFERVRNAHVSWTNPNIGIVYGSKTTSIVTLAQLSSASAPRFRSRISGYDSKLLLVTTTTNTGSTTGNISYIQTFADEDSGEWPMFPVFVVGVVPYGVAGGVPVRGYKGTLYDFWFGSSSNHSYQYPADLSRQFSQIGYAIVPWNGSAILVA